jgi:hypothetical protein
MFWWWRKTLSKAQCWALAVGGPITVANGCSFTELRMSHSKATCRQGLREGYDVHDLDALKAVRHWLLHEGHHQPCLEVCRLLRESPEFPDLDPDEPPLHRFVAEHLEELEQSQLVGFDLSRLVVVARFAYTAGYIEGQEAWSWIFDAARGVQRAFTSWEGLGRDCFLGHHFLELSGGYPVSDAELEAYEWLAHYPFSPWRCLPWDTPLGPQEGPSSANDEERSA